DRFFVALQNGGTVPDEMRATEGSRIQGRAAPKPEPVAPDRPATPEQSPEATRQPDAPLDPSAPLDPKASQDTDGAEGDTAATAAESAPNESA
ncbi:hypothetical protein R0K05_20040, partial [Planococcus sp. SIMBA_160]